MKTHPYQPNQSTVGISISRSLWGFLLTRAHLNNEEIPFEPVYVRSHDSVYRAVASGLYSAGGGVKRTLKSMEPEVQDKLSIAWTTEKYTPHALAAHQRVSEETKRAVQIALGKLNEPTQFVTRPIGSRDGRWRLMRIGMTFGIWGSTP